MGNESEERTSTPVDSLKESASRDPSTGNESAESSSANRTDTPAEATAAEAEAEPDFAKKTSDAQSGNGASTEEAEAEKNVHSGKDVELSKDPDSADEPPLRLEGSKRAPDETVAEYLKRQWRCEIERASMQDWRKREWHNLRWPMPIIQAFYLQKPVNTSDTISDEDSSAESEHAQRTAVPEDVGDLKNLQRISIHSEYINHELLSITSVLTMQDPIIIGPPYKLLMRSFPEIQVRLVKLKAEMEDAIAKANAEEAPTSAEEEEDSSSDSVDKDASGSVKGKYSPEDAQSDIEQKKIATDSPLDRRDLAIARYQHLEVLHDFIKKELRDVLELRRKVTDGSLSRVRFEDLWHLFHPGDIIYSRDHERDQLLKVYFVTGGQSLKRFRTDQEATEITNIRDKLRLWAPPDQRESDEEETVEKTLREEGSGIGTWTPFKVDCFMMTFDGEYCGPVDVCKKIRPYVGEREITSLPMFPLRFLPDGDTMCRSMEDRGRKFLFASGHKSYDGRTLAMRRSESQIEIESDVYIDFDAYYQDFPVKKPNLGRLLRSRQNFQEEEELFAPGAALYRVMSGHEVDAKLSDDFLTANRVALERFKPKEHQISSECLSLMPHYVVGYAFQLRRWYDLDIDLVKDIDRESAEARAAGFDDLVISKRYRDLLVALVDSHASGFQRGKEKIKHADSVRMRTQIDLVRGKGQGLIILLHGPPGSGKTSTAETIAAYTRRPLYSITCGDIGTQPEIVEKNLLEHTRRADKWGCVLLLDEADVFLLQRDWHNLQRNALVSVFLRQLEYYAGILFLTTNRPGVMDEAFKSRVHISLRYPGVDLESTKQMWSNIMRRLEQDNKQSDVQVVFDKEGLLEFAQRQFEKYEKVSMAWNGRQIRNAFQTALALGHYERLSKIRDSGMTPEEAMATGKKKWRTVKLTKANFQNIAKTAREFEEYIESLRGSDSINAREGEIRYDDFDPERPRARKLYPAVTTRDAGQRLHSNVSAQRPTRPRQNRSARPELDLSEVEDEGDDESEDLSPEEDE